MSLSRRLSLVFAALLLACGLATGLLLMRAAATQEQEVVQRLSVGLAAHIADQWPLLGPDGPNAEGLHTLFGQLMAVNPSAEVYLLGPGGEVLAEAATPGHVLRQRVDLAPVQRLLRGEPLPILGDDPRSPSARKVFSAAPLRAAGRDAGYLYVVLLGEAHDALASHLSLDQVLLTGVGPLLFVLLAVLSAGLLAFRWVTRPLRALTVDVQRFESQGPAALPTPLATGQIIDASDEVLALRLAYVQMTQRIAGQWQALAAKDRQRRELVANISHDLRTPLTSLHGYLETLKLRADRLSEDERRRYLDVALGQSLKVGRLAQSLFEWARLEYGGVEAECDDFPLIDLLQDVLQKFELAAQARQIALRVQLPAGLPDVQADLGLIERVLTNLLDNAIRHAPVGGWVEVAVRACTGGAELAVSDNGPGVPPALRQHLFERPSFQSGEHSRADPASGGLGLVIVQCILRLHGSEIRLDNGPADGGAVFRFRLQAVTPPPVTDC